MSKISTWNYWILKFHLAHLLGEPDMCKYSQVPIVFDLESFTDKILAGVKDLLSVMRKHFSIAEPSKVESGSLIEIKYWNTKFCKH